MGTAGDHWGLFIKQKKAELGPYGELNPHLTVVLKAFEACVNLSAKEPVQPGTTHEPYFGSMHV